MLHEFIAPTKPISLTRRLASVLSLQSDEETTAFPKLLDSEKNRLNPYDADLNKSTHRFYPVTSRKSPYSFYLGNRLLEFK